MAYSTHVGIVSSADMEDAKEEKSQSRTAVFALRGGSAAQRRAAKYRKNYLSYSIGRQELFFVALELLLWLAS